MVNSLAMSGPDEGWAIGQYYQNSHWYGLVYRYSGGTWQQVASPFGGSTPRGIYAHPSMPGQAWMTGGDSETAARLIPACPGRQRRPER